MLHPKDEVFVIYLHSLSPASSSNLPPDIERAALHASVYMVLQPISSTALYVTMQTGELLPHLFTLTSTSKAVIFCYLNSALTNSFPLGSMMLCVARTFLFLSRKTRQRQTELLYIYCKCNT